MNILNQITENTSITGDGACFFESVSSFINLYYPDYKYSYILSNGIKYIQGKNMTKQLLRQLMINFVIQNQYILSKDQFGNPLIIYDIDNFQEEENVPTISLEKWIIDMQMPYKWADQLAIRFTAYAINQSILVIEKGIKEEKEDSCSLYSNNMKITQVEYNCQLKLINTIPVFYNGTNHYTGVFLKDKSIIYPTKTSPSSSKTSSGSSSYSFPCSKQIDILDYENTVQNAIEYKYDKVLSFFNKIITTNNSIYNSDIENILTILFSNKHILQQIINIITSHYKQSYPKHVSKILDFIKELKTQGKKNSFSSKRKRRNNKRSNKRKRTFF